MIVRKIEIQPDRFNQKVSLPKRRKMLDVIKFRGRPHIVFEHRSANDTLFATGDIEKHIAEGNIEFENVIIYQIPEQRYIREINKYLGYWKTAADITYVYLKTKRR